MPGADVPVPGLSMTVEARGGWVVVRLAGELTFRTCDALARVLNEPADSAEPLRMAVDASSGLEFFDSSGMRCLVLACRRIRRAGGQFVVINNGELRRKATVMALGEYLPVHPALPA